MAHPCGLMKLLLTLVLLVAWAGAQTLSSHSGWNFTDTLQTATGVVAVESFMMQMAVGMARVGPPK
jgi:hypothetical protein